jgi:hypothetical protein
MNAQLQQFANEDAGFRQFCERYSRVAADPRTRREYHDWIYEQMREQGLKEGGRVEERRKWTGIVAEKDAALAEKDASLAEQEAALAKKDSALAEQKAALADKDALIAELRARLK